ncbi:hypothetical protein RA11412_2674 [Rothia aeria]|uniref:Uncharacterized protein n=1 Tax=Rothia aeria TaxID=172042 RepID=A0A2Z5R2P8_9MICC|nr:hypothetical protein RA11412_2674 [Rothia aeria]
MTEQEEHKRHILSEYAAQILAATTRSAGSLEDNLVDVFRGYIFLPLKTRPSAPKTSLIAHETR